MPDDEKNKPADKPPDLAKLIADALPAALAGLPALIDQTVAKHIAALAPKPPDKPKDDGGEGKTDWKQIVADMQKKDVERDRQLAEERAKAALAGAVAVIPFFDPQDAIRELAPSVTFKAGQHVVPGTKTVLGVPAPYDYSLDEAVRGLAAKKPHWVRSDVKGGTGAGGNTGAGGHDFSREPTYDELMRPENANLLAEFSEKHPDRFAQIQRDGLVGLQNRS